MADCFVPDGGPRFPEVFALRLPSGFLALIKDAAEAEGISPRDFARRAIADRISRTDLERAGTRTTPTDGEPQSGATTPSTPLAASEAVSAPVAAPQAQAADQPAQPPRRRASWT